MAKTTTQFSLDGFQLNPDGSYSKKKTGLQPREIFKSTSINVCKPSKVSDSVIGCKVPDFVRMEHIQNKVTGKQKKSKKEEYPTFWKGKNIQDIFAEATSNNFIFIPNNVPSSKNAKRAFKGIVLESLLCVEYRKNTKMHWKVFKPRFLKMIEGKEKPYRIEMMFIRDSKRRSDYHNLVQLPFDLMTDNEWIDDDNMDEVVPVPPYMPYAIDKLIPGLIIKVL